MSLLELSYTQRNINATRCMFLERTRVKMAENLLSLLRHLWYPDIPQCFIEAEFFIKLYNVPLIGNYALIYKVYNWQRHVLFSLELKPERAKNRSRSFSNDKAGDIIEETPSLDIFLVRNMLLEPETVRWSAIFTANLKRLGH